MKYGLFIPVLASASLVLAAQSSRGQTFTETTDAGQTLATAQTTASATSPTGQNLSMIVGSIGTDADADLFKIYLTNPATFSATTDNSVTNASGLDTALFLFSSTGVAIETNDDESGLSYTSTLPAGESFTASLPAGYYYLGISGSGNEPVNSASQLLFKPYPGGDTTAVRGAATGVNPTTLATFNANGYSGNNGAYEIDLTGAEAVGGGVVATSGVPEPSTWVMLFLGAAAMGWRFRLRTK
jgi:hypothetical protein